MNLPAAAFTVHDPSLAQQKLAAYAVTNPDNITQTKQRNFHVTAITATSPLIGRPATVQEPVRTETKSTYEYWIDLSDKCREHVKVFAEPKAHCIMKL